MLLFGNMAIETTLSPRERIVRATEELLSEGGREAISTRAVADAAGVQTPTIYRQFGDMQGLLDEVVNYGFSKYLKTKLARETVEDPVEDLRQGWDLHVEFGLSNPALYTLMYGNPWSGAAPTAALEAHEILHRLVQRVAEAGRLRVSVESAADLMGATGVGVVLSLIATKREDRNLTLPDMARESVLAAVTTDEADEALNGGDGRRRVANRAVALKAILPEAEVDLTPGESTLLSEWLDKLAHFSSS